MSIPEQQSIEQLQIDKIRKLLSEIIPENRFYADKLRNVDFKEIATLDAFRSAIPFTTKSELMEDQLAHPPYGSNLMGSLENFTRFHQTSATTGVPLRWLDTEGSWEWILDNWIQIFKAVGVTESDRCFFAFSFAPFLGFWSAYDAACKLGCLCIPGGGMRSRTRLQVMLDNKISVMCCTPTYAIHLGQTARSNNIDLTDAALKMIIVAGEPGGAIPATKQRIESLWPTAAVYDHHGMTEVGPVSYPCSRMEGVLHILSASYFAEIIDPETLNATESGIDGELVLTTLGRFTSPLLRYRTGDWVKQTKQTPCACGTYDIGLDGGILTRVDDMVIVRGVNIYPAAVEDIIRSFPEIIEYKVQLRAVNDLDEMDINIEISEENLAQKNHIIDHLVQKLYDVFSLRINVAAVAVNSLPRFELKSKRWISILSIIFVYFLARV